ncbi:DUF4340 domain-containing protein [bacterium]|nr:DUF4340 domain-containing protein [candidate division CSSED10-310 bacterium]
MRPRNTIIAFLILVVLVGIWLILDRPFHEDATKPEKVVTVFPDFSADAITSFQVISQGDAVELRRKDNAWVVMDGDAEYPADVQAVTTLLDKTAALKKIQIASTNPEKRGVYQVDSQGTEVKLFSGADLRCHFFVGKNGPDFFSTFVRVEGSDEVMLVPEYLKTHFDKRLNSWKDRTLLSVEKERIKSLRIERAGKEPIALEYKGDGWFLTEPEAHAADEKAINRLLGNLSRYMATDYAELREDGDYGFSAPSMTLTVGLDDTTTKTILLGAPKDTTGYYAKTMDSDWIFIVPKYRFTTFDKDWEELKAVPTPVPEPAAE